MKGLYFKKLDLHIHTPASSDFQKPAGKSDSEIAKLIIEKALSEKLDAIAITDHNSGEWIDIIKTEAHNKNLIVFPGVEITCVGGRGVHIIALFDQSKNKEHVKALLSRLELEPEAHGKETAIVNKSPNDVINEIIKCEGLAILAHINSSHGVFEEMEGQARINIIQNKNVAAAEATDYFNEEKKQRKKRAIDFLDGTDENYKTKLAVFQSSDNPAANSHGHTVEGIGSRFTYFKMETINIISLKNCFNDPDVRIRHEIKEKKVFPVIKKIKINGGFLDGLEMDFHQGLNSIIGSKGSGKSLLIEFLRFGLNQEPTNENILTDHESKLENRLKIYGEIELELKLDTGNIIKIKRQYDPSNNNPFIEGNEVDVSRIFPVLFLSQNEIIKIAEDNEEQLKFIDRFFDFKDFQEKIFEHENELKDLDNQLASGIKAYLEMLNLGIKVKTKETTLAELDSKLKSPIFDRYSKSEMRNQGIKNSISYINNLKSKNISALKLFNDIPSASIDPQIIDEPLFKRITDIINKSKDIIAETFTNMERDFDAKVKQIYDETKDFFSTHKKISEEYESHVKTSGGNYQTLANKRQILNREINDLNQRYGKLKENSEKIKDINNARHDLIEKIENIRKEYTTIRKEKCKMFSLESADKLSIEIQEATNIDVFREKLIQLKRGSYLREVDIDTICNSISPKDFIYNLIKYSIRREPKQLSDIITNSKLESDKVITLANYLLEAYELRELLEMQYKAAPEDKPIIKYQLENEEYAHISEISVGQKSTAFLIMGLSDGNMPIIIDQPEDSLDLKTVWNDVCLKLRKGKEQRQFLFTTHNSSVAVASDSDNFIILESDAVSGELKNSGAMDNNPVGNEVLNYLEGGLDTYNLKMKKYNVTDKLKNAK